MVDRSDTETCDVCGRRATVVGVFSIRYVPLSLGHCQACIDNDAYPESWVKWVLGMVPDDSERRSFFAEFAQVVDDDGGYRRLTSEELDEHAAEGRWRCAKLRAEIAEAR